MIDPHKAANASDGKTPTAMNVSGTAKATAANVPVATKNPDAMAAPVTTKTPDAMGASAATKAPDANAPTPLLSCRNISLSYDSHLILSDLSFDVQPGMYLCIVGENGSGKSTLMKALLGLKSPTHGELLFAPDLRRTQIGYLPQHTEAQKDFPASVWEVAMSGCLSGRGAAAQKLAMDNLTRLGIADLKKRSYRELSGGQQQRVLLARALCATSRLMLLDEPVSGLDPMITQDFYRLIADINRSGVTIVMASHDVHVVRQATHILHLHRQPLFFGPTEEYLNSTVGKRFLGGCEHV